MDKKKKTLLRPLASSEAVRRSMKANRPENTNPELKLRQALIKAGLSGYRLHWKHVPGNPDIAYPGRKVAIFVNGCFWHRCPKCKPKMPKKHRAYWAQKFGSNVARDKRVVSELKEVGWVVLILWECEIAHDLCKIIKKAKKLIHGI
jgi:DNA mismatch endonuclease (patch repair protein)